MSWLKLVRTGQRAHVLQRLQNLDSWFETAGWRVVGISEWDRIVLDEVDDVDWPGGGYSYSREVRQEVRQRGGMSQLKLRDET